MSNSSLLLLAFIVLLLCGLSAQHMTVNTTLVSELTNQLERTVRAMKSEIVAAQTRHIRDDATTQQLVGLAHQRKGILKQLIMADAHTARSFLLHNYQLSQLFNNHAIVQDISLFESYMDVRANYYLVCRTKGGDPMQDVMERFVELVPTNGSSAVFYRAFTYGNQTDMMSLKNARVKGFLVDNIVLVDESTAELNSAASRVARDRTYTTGSKSILFVKLDFSDMAGDFVSTSSIDSSMSQLRDFWNQNSFGAVSVPTYKVTRVYRMPNTAASYRTSGNYMQLMTDAINTAAAGGDRKIDYSFLVLAYPRVFPGWSGMGIVGSSGVWMNGYCNFGVLAHELGHNLGMLL